MCIIHKTFAAIAFAGLALVATVDASAAPVRDGAYARNHRVVHHRHHHHRGHHHPARRVAVRAY